MLSQTRDLIFAYYSRPGSLSISIHLQIFVVKVSMAGTPYATQTFVSNFWCNFLSRKRKHARNLEQHHILFKELSNIAQREHGSWCL